MLSGDSREEKVVSGRSSFLYISFWNRISHFSSIGSHLKILPLKQQAVVTKEPLRISFLEVAHLLKEALFMFIFMIGVKHERELLIRQIARDYISIYRFWRLEISVSFLQISFILFISVYDNSLFIGLLSSKLLSDFFKAVFKWPIYFTSSLKSFKIYSISITSVKEIFKRLLSILSCLFPTAFIVKYS